MIFGNWRGTPLALALATTIGLSLALARSAQADGLPIWQHTIPREVDAYNFATGGSFMAPPVPYGHYAKDHPLYEAHKALGCLTCKCHALLGLHGSGHFLHGGHGDGSGGDGYADGGIGGTGCGTGHGLFGHHGGSSYGGYDGLGVGAGSAGYATTAAEYGTYGGNVGLGGGSGGYATTAAGPSGQAVVSQPGHSICGKSGCNVSAKHSHFGHLLGSHGGAGAYGVCDDPGCGLGAGHKHGGLLGHGGGRGTGCEFCGGKGCAYCQSGHGFGHLSSLLAKHASLIGALHGGPKTSWFLGAGGPVPLTPGYVPYIVTTRSPRDFFAFPPMNPNDP
jgi:hypothetical protein